MESIPKKSTLTENEILNKRLTQWLNNSELGIKGCEEPTPTSQEDESAFHHVEEKQDKVNDHVLFSGFVSDNVVNQKKKKKKKRARYSNKFFLLIRAVLLETSFIKMIRKKKKKHKQKKEKTIYPVQELYSEDENVKTASTRYSSSGSSSSVTSSTRNRSTSSDGGGTYVPKIGFYYVLMSLFVLIFWGKACAIVCTCTWLLFVPRRSVSNNVSSRIDEISKACSERYKKKVIMEGLLERNNSI